MHNTKKIGVCDLLKKWAAAAAVLMLILSGCIHKDANSEPVKTVKKESQVTKEGLAKKTTTSYFFPLTGKSSKVKPNGRAIAVMINNHPKARPQSGLNKADIVYEILAEGGITRFLAIFQNARPENIGPVRSARPYYIQLAKGFNALYIAHGYSPDAKKMLDEGYADQLNGMVYDGTLFKRASFRPAPHNSYITYENILKGADQKGYSMNNAPPPFKFMTDDEAEKLKGDSATSVKVSYFSDKMFDCMYQYDPLLGKYKRFSGGVQTVDLETKEPILLDNIFIIEAVHQVVDSGGHRHIDLKSGGNGYLLQMGKVNKVEWENVNNRIVPFTDGLEVPFVQGKTWVNVVPTNPGLLKSVSFNVK